MLSTWFATPVLLLTLLALPICACLYLYAYVRRARATARLANPLLLRKLTLMRPHVRRWRGLFFLLALTLLAVACAGPQWGLDPDAQKRKGREVIIVLDLSRSMRAEQPSRRLLAIRALRQLADNFEEHGGNRVALVGFASQARLFFPLTQDYDHLRYTLAQIEIDDYPPLTAADAVSGTRIGAALSLAVASIDPARRNRPAIVLLSDGDDPVNDNEWQHGVQAAKDKRIRIHTVGVGTPQEGATIPVGSELLQFEGVPVRTHLNEPRLQEIARASDGVYLPAHHETLALGAFIQHLLDADELREESLPENALPVHQLRYQWLLLPAVLLFMLTLLMNEGPAPASTADGEKPAMKRTTPKAARPVRAVAMALALIAFLGAGAADPPTVEALLRQGNAAFEREAYADAIKLYDQVEVSTRDPGLVSFNKAAAHFRLKNYKEAIDCYRRALEDAEAPQERRTRAYFDLGNALLKSAGESSHQLADAVAAYRACLHQPNVAKELSADARHNLELAQMLWLKARKKEPAETKEAPPKKKDPLEQKDPKEADTQYVPVEPGKKTEVKIGATPAPKKSPNLNAGTIQHLPDDENLRHLAHDDALRTLDEAARRIAEARRRQHNHDGPLVQSTKDW
jgi:Ca-activated chloride channel homolog